MCSYILSFANCLNRFVTIANCYMGSELDAREARIDCEFSEFESLRTTTNRHMWSPGFGCHGILKTLQSLQYHVLFCYMT